MSRPSGVSLGGMRGEDLAVAAMIAATVGCMATYSLGQSFSLCVHSLPKCSLGAAGLSGMRPRELMPRRPGDDGFNQLIPIIPTHEC